MSEIFGNSEARRIVSTLTGSESPVRVSVLVGIPHVGKRSFLESLLTGLLEESDLSFAEPSVDGIRESRDFLATGPLFSPYKAVVVDDADLLSDQGQDALLKVLEEPPTYGRIFLVSEDVGRLSPPLQSRLECEVRWFPLSDAEMRDFASSIHRLDESALALSRGRPGLYNMFLGDSRYQDLYDRCLDTMNGTSDPILSKIPEILSSVKTGRSLERDGICHVLSMASSQARSVSSSHGYAARFLRLSSDLLRIPSLSVDIHWRRACLVSVPM